VFLSEQCTVSKVTSVWTAVFRPWHKPIIVLPLAYCPTDNTLFEVSSEIRCSVCQVAIVVMETTQLVPSQFKKNFFTHQLRIEYGLSLPKIISKRCELIAGIRYCGFLRHSVCGYAMLCWHAALCLLSIITMMTMVMIVVSNLLLMALRIIFELVCCRFREEKYAHWGGHRATLPGVWCCCEITIARKSPADADPIIWR